MGQDFRQQRRQRTAADQQYRLRHRIVQLQDLGGDRLGQFRDNRSDVADDIGRRCRVFQTKDIYIMKIFDIATKSSFQCFRHFEVQQQLRRQFFGDFIAGSRHHAVADDRAVAGDRHVGGSGPDIDQHQIEMAHRWRNQHIDCGDRFQRQGADLQAGGHYCGLQRVDDLAGQKRGDDLYRGFLTALTDQGFHCGPVEREPYDAVADAVITGRIIDHAGRCQLFLRCLDCGQLERAFFLQRQIAFAVHIQLGVGVEGGEGATGGGDGHLF